MGPKMPWRGSKRPQSSVTGLLSLTPSMVFVRLFDSRFLRPFFLPFPVTGTAVGRRDETAALREAMISFVYWTWPSLAPFSIGPVEGQ